MWCLIFSLILPMQPFIRPSGAQSGATGSSLSFSEPDAKTPGPAPDTVWEGEMQQCLKLMSSNVSRPEVMFRFEKKMLSRKL